MDREAYEQEIARLHEFVLQLADRIARASEVPAKVAEKKPARSVPDA